MKAKKAFKLITKYQMAIVCHRDTGEWQAGTVPWMKAGVVTCTKWYPKLKHAVKACERIIKNARRENMSGCKRPS